jgi:hypothetical protein
MKIKLIDETDDEKEVVISVSAIPRVGEQVMLGAAEVAEVIQVVHTPTSETHDAIVSVRKASAGRAEKL